MLAHVNNISMVLLAGPSQNAAGYVLLAHGANFCQFSIHLNSCWNEELTCSVPEKSYQAVNIQDGSASSLSPNETVFLCF